jgi:IPT/TIG domain
VTAVAGSWAPFVIDGMGIVPIDPNAALINVFLKVSSVTPSIDLNPFGGSILTITGTGLPHATSEGNTFAVTFSDGSSCNVVSIASTQIRCLTTGFDVS